MPYIKHQPDLIDTTIMLELRKYPPSTMRYIGQVIGRTHVSVKHRIDWLMEHGYIRRAENAGRSSARSIILTELGFKYLQNAQ